MPNLDKTGPEGKGQSTGCCKGNCDVACECDKPSLRRFGRKCRCGCGCRVGFRSRNCKK